MRIEVVMMRMLCVAGMCCVWAGGCAQQATAVADKMLDKIVIPVTREAMANQQVQAMIGQASMQGINPTMVISGDGKIVQGVEWQLRIGVEGVAGQVQMSGSSAREEDVATSRPAE